jgi:hypothetical protein
MGCTLIRRNVLATTMAAHPELEFEVRDGEISGGKKTLSGIWHMTIQNRALVGEDVAFCRRAQALGFKTHALIDADTKHYGTVGFRSNVLRSMLSAGATAPT